MQINTISNNNFEGRVLFDRNLPKHMQNYANQVLDLVVEGKTVRDKLAEKTFDMVFFTTSSRKAIKPKLEFYSGFKVSNPSDKKYYNSRIRVDKNYYENAKKLSEFIDRIQDAKQSYNGYNTFGERLKIWYHDMMINFLSKW